MWFWYLSVHISVTFNILVIVFTKDTHHRINRSVKILYLNQFVSLDFWYVCVIEIAVQVLVRLMYVLPYSTEINVKKSIGNPMTFIGV